MNHDSYDIIEYINDSYIWPKLVNDPTILTDFTLRAKFNIKIAHFAHGLLEIKEELGLVKGIAINEIPGPWSVE